VKAILLMHCLCEGHVSAWIPDAVTAWGNAKGIRGFDENTGEAIPQDNIVVPPCPREMEQIPFTVVIENPYTCQTFNEGTIFPVKAMITNGASEDLVDVSAYLSIYGNAALVNDPETQDNPKAVGNITAGGFTEITWLVKCTGGGEVYFGVTATSSTPLLTAYTADWPYSVNVHQIPIPHADIIVTILSPDESQHGQDWDVGHKHAMIATGQQFAVSAKIENNGPQDATNVIADIDPIGCDSLHYVTLVDGQSEEVNLGTIDAYDFEVVTWTLWGGADHDYAFEQCDAVNDTICVNATSDITDLDLGNNEDNVDVSVYPAAFLVTSIEDVTPDTLSVGGLFTVEYRITNYGVADATSVLANLSVSPAGAAVLAQTPDPTESMPRTIAGWTWGEPYNSVEGSFTLRAMQATPFTVTIAPTGEDECGWHALVGTECYYEDEDGGGYEECEPQYNWVQFAFWPIQSRFLAPASVTLEPGVTGGEGCPDVTSVDITLNSGWNLI
jgi:hypothetical protein